MTYSDFHKVMAARHFSHTRGDVHEAARLLLIDLKAFNLTPPADPVKFVKRWGRCIQRDGSIKGHAKRSGRRSPLTAQQLLDCYREAIGWYDAGRPGPYASITALAEQSPKVKDIIAATGVKAATLRYWLKKRFRTFRYRMVVTKELLTDTHKRDRVAACKKALKRSPRDLQRVVWVDAKSMILVVRSRRAWVDTDVCDYEGRHRPPQLGSQIINLKYYIGVNALLGAYWIAITTGTTNIDKVPGRKKYQVSSANKQARGVPSMHMHRRRPELLSPLLGTGALTRAAVNMEPEHTETVGPGGGGQLVVFLCPST
jgi:hypothetical protein